MNKLEKGCTFGLVLQQKVADQEKNMQAGFERVVKKLDTMEKKMETLTNEVMERPSKQATRQVNILLGAVGALSGAVVTLLSILIYGARL